MWREMPKLEKCKEKLENLCEDIRHLKVKEAYEMGHDLFMHSISIYANVSFAIGGKEGWKKTFQDVIQEQLNKVAKVVREAINEYVESIPNTKETTKW